MRVLRSISLSLAAAALLLSTACLPSPPEDTADKPTVTLYGFSIMKDVMEKEIFPAFAAKWKAEHGIDVNFVSSFAGSETVTNQILQGTPADVAVLSIERDAERLRDGKATTTDWHRLPQKGIVNKTPFVIIVRTGNPQHIQDFADLGRPGVRLIHPDPVSSGGAQWSLLAIYGSELKKSKDEMGNPDPVRALNTLKAIWANVISTPGSAREARTQFETGNGDAFITYELEGIAMKQAGGNIDVVVPKATIYSEHPVVIIDRNLEPAKRAIVQAFIEYLWSDDAQKAFVKYGLRSVTNDALNQSRPDFANIEMPFTVDEMFGGWDKAFPDVIQGVFMQQVQGKK
jgi:sulfate/thiosulfate-binding protein